MILKQGHKYEPMPHDGKVIRRIYRGGRCYYKDSPYSLAATQALKAAFPQYWTAIRDYGWANPALVPFINEDPMLIVSLVEVGKTRWLVGDGKAWIQVPIRISTSNSITTIVKNIESASTFQCLFSTSPSTAFRLWVSNSKCICTINGTESLQINFDGIGKFEYNGESWMVDGVVVNTYKGTPVIADSFCLYNLSSSTSRQPFSAMSEFNVKDIAHLVPCQHQGQCGMVDAISLTFYPNANTLGTFTIAITDKE